MTPFEVTFCSTTAMEARKCKNCLKLWFCFLCWQIWLFIIVKSYNIVAAHLTRGKWKLLITCELKIAKNHACASRTCDFFCNFYSLVMSNFHFPLVRCAATLYCLLRVFLAVLCQETNDIVMSPFYFKSIRWDRIAEFYSFFKLYFLLLWNGIDLSDKSI